MQCDTWQATNSRSPAKSWAHALELTATIAKNRERLLSSVIEDRAEVSGQALALISTNESMTYQALTEHSNQCTRWALQQGLAKGNSICLMMPNSPKYMAIWLGVARVGCTVALVNTNLTGRLLAHSINIVEPKHVIVAAELAGQLNSALPYLTCSPKTWVQGEHRFVWERFDLAVESFLTAKLSPNERRPVTIDDCALYLYTSGTTGFPKATNVSHARLLQWSYWFAGMMEINPPDRLYNCLPMYHSVGGIVATGAMLVAGGSVIIRDGFSASQFWNEIVRWNCTLFQYIGELCRYLLNTPQNSMETQHRIRMCCGNGLRPDIWNEFKSRFCIPKILEFYAATEGNVSLFNVEGKPGAIGRIPSYLAHRFPAALVRFDVEKQEPVRNEQGFCVRAAPHEVGEAVGRIYENASTLGNRFEGYTSSEESEKKILRDVFEQGDAWFRTGDLMHCDEQGYFYFVDRTGDTFRWKGENVSTTQVSEAICLFPGVKLANVYGVTVPGSDGRAGMALIVPHEYFDLAGFRTHLYQHLPEYAHPLFLRLCNQLEMTATFKHTKQSLQQQGFDPATVQDPMYFNDHHRGTFVLLDADLYHRLQSGQAR